MSYQPVGLAAEIFTKRHALHPEESWEDGCRRVARHVASAEGPKLKEHEELFSDLLLENQFMPGGRIWYGSGRPKGQLLNCFVTNPTDSREGWGRTTSDLMVISGTGGGVGMNFSPIRPKGSKIAGTGGEATGPVSLMRIQNAVGEELKAGGGRRVAMMHALSIRHPDIEEFLDAKLDKGQLNNANVSVVFDEDPIDFFEAVRAGGDFELRWGGKVHRRVSASALWDRIVQNALKGGEPGILNGFLANRMSNVYYYAPLICTNPCGEVWLPAYDCCDLGALVLPRFVKWSTMDWAELARVIGVAVRFLDDVLTINQYPLQEIKDVCSGSRRIGLGIMGLDTMLLQLGYSYGTPSAVEFVDKLMNKIKNAAYLASVELAKEKGPFPQFEARKFLASGFARQLKPSIRAAITEHGIRNCALLTVAPTGTTAMVCDVDGGIEPAFGPGWVRTYRDGAELKSETVIHPLFKKLHEAGQDVGHFRSSLDLDLRSHFEMQRCVQKHLDNSVSKTINLRAGTSAAELSDLYQEFLPDLKGVTVYPDGSREDQPIRPITADEALAHLRSVQAPTEAYVNGEICRFDGTCG